MAKYKLSLARIFSQSDKNTPVGMGTAITENHILTCNHVIKDALGLNSDEPIPNPKNQEIFIDFPSSEIEEDYSKFTTCIKYFNPSEDIAILELIDGIPLEVTPMNFFDYEKPKNGNRYSVMGVPYGYGLEGQESSGIIGSENFSGHYQLTKDNDGFPIKNGYSGTLVKTEQTGVMSHITKSLHLL